MHALTTKRTGAGNVSPLAAFLLLGMLAGCVSNPCDGTIEVEQIPDVDNGAWTQVSDFLLGLSSWAGTGSIQFVDDSTGFAYSVNVNYSRQTSEPPLFRSLLRKTTDAGETWIPVYSTYFDEPIGLPRDIHFASPTTGWMALDGGTLAKTTDGGETWNVQFADGGTYLRGIRFRDTLNGYVTAGAGNILKTTDGGANWVSVQSGSGWYLNDLDLVGPNRGVAVGGRGRIVQTSDAGATWVLRDTVSIELNAVRFSDSNTVWAVGGRFGEGVLYQSTDAGVTWSRHPRRFPFPLHALTFVDARTGYLVGGGNAPYTLPPGARSGSVCDDPRIPRHTTILKTTDGGETWQDERTVRLSEAYYLSTMQETGFDEGLPFLAVACNSAGDCFAGGWRQVFRRQ